MNSDDTPLGTLLRDGDRLGLRFVRELRHPPEKVWRALTDSEHLAAWMPCDLEGERRAGARLVARFWPAVQEKYGMPEAGLPAEIRVWDPPRVFEWTWDTDLLRFELEPIPGGTRLRLTTWIGTPEGQPPVTDVAGGYHVCLDHLRQLLDTGSAPSVAVEDPAAASARYTSAFASM